MRRAASGEDLPSGSPQDEWTAEQAALPRERRFASSTAAAAEEEGARVLSLAEIRRGGIDWGGGREGRMRAAVEEGSAGDGLGVGEARGFSGHGRCR